MASALLSWLALRSPGELAAIIERRPDALPAADLDTLAERLERDGSTAAALSTVPLPQAQVVEALAGLGAPSVGPDRLARLLGRPEHDPDLAEALAGLAELALVWPDETGALRMAAPLLSSFEFPLGLGPAAGTLLETVDRDRLAGVAATWRVRTDRPRQLAGAVAAVLADAQRVRAAVDAAPADTRELLDRLAHDGPVADQPEPALAWALDRGLVFPDGWRRATMPREVAVALRGPDWHAPFDPRPPALAVNLAPAAAVEREAVAAGTLAVQRVGALLDLAEQSPLAFLRSGGVGPRELRRAAKLTGADETEMRLWLELGYAAGLLGLVDETVAPTAAYDEWRAATPAERLATLLTTWLTLPTVPTADRRPGGGPPLAALLPDLAWAPVLDGRPGLLRLLGTLPPGRGAAADGIPAALRWRLPVVLPAPHPVVEGTLHEAGLLGVVAHGALSPLGRALAEAPDTLVAVGAGLLPDTVAEAIFEADLTALVPGLPAAPLATLLDTAAERTAADGNASTWRFTAGSVRAALDAGFTAETLLAALRIVAADGALPQVLAYLVEDVGRQHGQVRVRAVGCVLRTDSAALATELLGTRSLRALGLVALAPTILSSPRSADETLDALRAAGYSPAGEDATGASVIRRAPRVRATPRRRPGQVPTARPAPVGDLVGLAERLLDRPARPRLVAAGSSDGGGPPTERPMLWLVPDNVEPDPGEPAEVVAAEVRRHTPQLDARQRDLLVYAIVVGGPVTIDYRAAGGDFSSRVVEPLELDGNRMVAWCRLREDERVFGLNRIEQVRPA
ncbi:DNA-binding protein [Asanoa ishikariensis]|uniref:Helicase conserved C-terminal domain-containing protein n=1 Tax=Asanoa ishikariensis TaxID=137265 RepID=A0A1H3MFT5_9ACTN|nr:helicase-associated domain-containing protein [Asanoa ishikariensis]GIF66110.1 DNA-binding protein [Asanoa ishikariensis]SDY75577.1 Helicase conserved C-terminal domain-containing protein [Asanoa ishikariensis]